MSKEYCPVLDRTRCNNCLKCITACHHGVFRRNEADGSLVVSYPQGCIPGCRECVTACPERALALPCSECRTPGSEQAQVKVQASAYSYDSYVPELKCEGRPKVAFICVHNSCRSQIAEALGKLLASDVFDSYSAGTALKDHINPDAVRLMKQQYQIDMEATQHNKLISNIPQPDVVIFMGCNVSCPHVVSQYAEDWGLEDPSGKSDEFFLETIAQIHINILRLKERLMQALKH